MRNALKIFGYLLICLVTLHSHADEVVLVNGDRLTGKVVRKEGTELIFKTDYAGELKIAWSKVARLTSDAPMSLVLSDQSQTKTREISAAPSKLSPDASSARQDTSARVPATRVASINATQGVGLFGARWKGRLNVGAGAARGNTDTDNVHLDFEVIARRPEDRLTFSGLYDHAKDSGELTKRKSRLTGKYDRFFRPKWYGYGLVDAEKDRFSDINLRTTLGAGIGHQLIEDERTTLALEGGLNYVRTDYDVASDENYPAGRWALKYDQRLFATELQLFHSHELVVDLQDSNRTFVRSQTGLRMPLVQRLLATAQINVDYENAPAPGKSKTDRTYLLTVGYHW